MKKQAKPTGSAPVRAAAVALTIAALTASASAAGPHPSSVVGRTAQPGAAGLARQPQALPGTWTAAAPIPQTLCRYGFVGSGNDFYTVGGVSNGSRVTNLNRYNAAANSWTGLAPVPWAAEAPTAALFNAKIYAIQGDTGNALSIYDIGLNSWSAGAAAPRSNYYGAAAGAWAGKVYVVGGGSLGASSQTDVYDIGLNSWSLGNPAPVPFFLAGYTQVGQYLYLVGGWGVSAPASNLTSTMRLDMATGTWSTGPAFTAARADFALAFAGGKLYAIGGDTSGGAFFDGSTSVDELDVSAWPAGSWVASGPALPFARQANQAGFYTTGRVGGEVWSTGGLTPAFVFLTDNVFAGAGAGGGIGGQGNLASTVIVSSSKNPSTFGDAVTFNANVVTNTPQFTPSGTIQFRDGGTVLGTGTLNLLGQTSFTTSALTVGAHTITAFYGGDVNYGASLSALLTQTVGVLPTSTTTLTSSLNPSNVGQTVTLTATVAPSAATGTVTFKDGSTTLGTGTLAAGVATLSTSALTAGSHALTAVYGGNASYQTSTSATLTQTVNKIATTTTLTSSKNPAKSGESVSFTATVAPSASTGTVTFLDGLTILGSASLSGGVATFATSSLAVGTHSITASYGGDATYASSTSAAISQNVLNAQGCTSGGTDTLCVQNTRFRISVAWTNQYAGNQTGVGTAYQLTSDSGDFTFFSANNIELVVKVLDGTAVNGKFWVGYASLTDVGFTITVTDTKNSVTKTYTNPPGTLASATDITAFAARPEDGALEIPVTGDEYGRLASLQAEAYRNEAPARHSERASMADAGACSTSGGNLCLNGGRFQLSVSWTNYNDGSKGTGTAIGLTSDSGYFWFFTPPNVELMCKVLDGTAVNGKFWLLYGSLTDVQFTLTAKDTNTSATKTYENAAKNQGSRIDINAF